MKLIPSALQKVQRVKTSKQKAKPRAIEQVFSIHELAVHIISHLDLIDILRIQRASKTLYSVVQSTFIQRLLYLVPTPTSKTQWHLDLSNQKLTRTLTTDSSSERRLCVPNPLVFLAPTVHQARLEWTHYQPPPEVVSRLVRRECPILHFRADLHLKDLNRTPLRDMFLTQPPITRMMVCWRWTRHEYWMSFAPIKIIRYGGVYNPNGIRCKDLLACVPFLDVDDEGDNQRRGMRLNEIDLQASEVAIDHGFEMWEGCETRWFAVSDDEKRLFERVQVGTQVRIEREARRWISYWY